MTVFETLRAERRTWWALTLGVPLGLYVSQLLLLCIRFGELPNYYTFYDWPANIHRIVRSTPSIRDILQIGGNEWLLEVGRRSVVYGLSVCEWRLAILPVKVLLLVMASAIAATNWVLFHRSRSACAVNRTAGALSASGLAVTSLTTVTISWVACCGVPSWVTGLTILGLGYSTALALQPFGALLVICGCACLVAGTLLLARRECRAGTDDGTQGSGESLVRRCTTSAAFSPGTDG